MCSRRLNLGPTACGGRTLSFELFRFAGLLGRLLTQPGPAMLLDFLFILPQLLFQLVDHAVDGRHEFAVGLFGHEVVLMFGVDAEFDFRVRRVLKIDRKFDFRKAFEQPGELLQLRSQLFLGRFA